MKELIGKYEEDEQLLGRLHAKEGETERSLYYAYRDYFIRFLVKTFNCKEEDAQEVYPESFTYFCFNIREGKLVSPLRSKLRTYLCSIGWRILLKRFPKYRPKQNQPSKLQFLPIDDFDWNILGNDPDVLEKMEWEEKARIVNKLLSKLDEMCSQVLKLRFWENLSFKEIAVKLNFKTEGATRKRNFDCIQKMRKMILASEEIQKYL